MVCIFNTCRSYRYYLVVNFHQDLKRKKPGCPGFFLFVLEKLSGIEGRLQSILGNPGALYAFIKVTL